jgi:hypothetical protein
VGSLHGGEGLGTLLVRDGDAAGVQRHLAVSQATAALLARDGLGEWGASA